MKKTRRLFFGAVILASVTVSSSLVRGAGDKTFEGEIADSQCALSVHSLNQSHKEMIDMGSAGKTPTDCARYCVRERGGRFVLQSKQGVYKLDNQELAEKSVGKKVKVTGTVDPKTNTIQVRTIEPITRK
jgi:type 1 fimbria pilin